MMSFINIAKELNLTELGVRMIYHNAISKIRDTLKDDEELMTMYKDLHNNSGGGLTEYGVSIDIESLIDSIDNQREGWHEEIEPTDLSLKRTEEWMQENDIE